MTTENIFRLRVVFVALLLSLSSAIADTSLYIPGYDEEPVSVTVIGVGPDGRTTWRIQPETPTGTIPPSGELSLTATMVQGPSDAVVYASLPNQVGISVSCAIQSSQANCMGEIDEGDTLTITTSFQESAKPYLVQGGGSSPTPTPAPTSSGGGPSPSTTRDTGSSLTNAAICAGLLVVSVAAGLVSSLLA